MSLQVWISDLYSTLLFRLKVWARTSRMDKTKVKDLVKHGHGDGGPQLEIWNRGPECGLTQTGLCAIRKGGRGGVPESSNIEVASLTTWTAVATCTLWFELQRDELIPNHHAL